MSAVLRIEEGAQPWSPAPDTRLEVELDRHDFPLAGIIRDSSSQLYLFSCLLGEMNSSNIWAYAPLEGEEVKSLTDSTGDQLMDAVDAALANKWLRVAFAKDWKLVLWFEFDTGQEGPVEIADRFLKRWKRVSGQSSGMDEMANQPELVDSCSG